MKKRCLSLASMMTFCFMLLLISGCGSSSNKESGSGGVVSNVGDTPCIQCHSANREALTGESLIVQYQNSSPHRASAADRNPESVNNGNGCEACHGSGSQHQGKGPIAYVNPYDNSGARCADSGASRSSPTAECVRWGGSGRCWKSSRDSRRCTARLVPSFVRSPENRSSSCRSFRTSTP